ncbi:outer membrane beta-barrel protein [Mucilaginibacter sp. 21P]|uniref:outer membrane beta-barrel protein n=1 Tax=Mucilaginibacter sp. 21P TaxID=2778902 RepID=UPI001C55F2AD|nr:outer membrane beta-barrel protein [Mucilaginibacter sp. 21P]QXV63969.1 outer membrane beta-barrel protein [Mucilaginibacter sp. 21P]
MKLQITGLSIAWLVIFTLTVKAQNPVSLSGQLQDQQQLPLAGVTINLIPQGSLTSKRSMITDSSGHFRFDNLPVGNYQLHATMIGSKIYQVMIPVFKTTNYPPIILQRDQQALKEVIISGRKPLVEQKVDRVIVNVDALASNAGGTVMEALEKAPGVIVDPSGGITLKGKGATVFIDDKPTYLSGTELENYLRSLPSSTIDQIELMTNPPARYDAEGNGGIINIRTKKNKVKGINGGANLSYVQGGYARSNNSANLTYRNNKLNVFANATYAVTNNYNDLDIYRYFSDASGAPVSNFSQNSYTRRTGQSYGAKITADYYLSGKTTLGIGITGLYSPSGQTIPVTSIFTDPKNILDSTVFADNHQKVLFKNAGINFNYRHTYTETGRQWTADLDYINYNSITNQSFNNFSYNPAGTLTNTYLLDGNLPTDIKIYAAKTDYVHPLKNGVELSAGLKSSYTYTDNVADYFYTSNQVSAPDYGKTNHFQYRENINAAYVNANREFRRLSVQAGLRMENTFSNGHQLGNIQKADSTFKRTYTNLFPTIYFQYKLDTANIHVLSLDYGRRIERPYYQDLNPFLAPLDKFTYYTGNPFLRPAFTNALELSHTYKSWLTTTLSYSRAYDQINETIEILKGTYFSRPGNVGRSTVRSISVDANLDPLSWLNIHLYGELTNIHTVSDFYTGPLDTKGTFYYLKPILVFKTGKNWTIQADGYYQSRVTNVQFVTGVQKRVNLVVIKKLSTSARIRFVINDALRSYVNSGTINNLAYTKANYVNIGDTRTAVLSLSYRFGKTVSGERKHEANGAETEQNRVKN